jgi:hypothetical protein
VDALVIGGVDGPGFLGIEREIAEALAGAHLSGAQDQMVGIDCADGVAVLGEVNGTFECLSSLAATEEIVLAESCVPRRYGAGLRGLLE